MAQERGIEQPVAPAIDTVGSNAAGFGPGRNKTGRRADIRYTTTLQPPAGHRCSDPLRPDHRAARTLVVQLQPIELGTVTARLRLTPEGMHIQLTAENTAMAEHLAKDHDVLGKALQRAGVADDASLVTISVIDRSGAASNTQTGQQNLSAQEQQSGARGNGQGHSGFQGTPGDRSGNQ